MKNLVEMKDVSFTYASSGEKALDHVSVHISEGECVLVTGASGCGKTTLGRVMNGLIPGFCKGELTGEVSLFGMNGEEISIEALVPHVGSVFQNPKTQFFNVNTTAEIAFPCENTGMEQAEIGKAVSRCSEEFGLAGLLDRSVFQISGGEKQRVACGAANVLNPELLVLDEPASNLDQKSVEELHDLILRMKQRGTSAVITEHRIAWLRDLADRVLFMEDGKIKQEYSGEEFRALSGDELQRMGLRQGDLGTIRDSLKKKEMKGTAGICTEKLEAGYRKHAVIAVPDLVIEQGKITGIMGNNGVGKSTFLRTLCGLLKPVSGSIRIDGKKMSCKELIRRSFLVMQDVNYQLFSDSVEEELLLGNEKKNPEEVLNTLDLLQLRDRHPMSLSGGQKQRTAIGCALMSDKDLIILDEPSSGQDERHMRETGEALKLLKEKGKTVIVVTHDEELADLYCDRIIRFEDRQKYGI